MSVATNDIDAAPDAQPGPLKDAILIAGPTASGKSALALKVAAAVGGDIVNADSMQVYSVLDVLTARPDSQARTVAPHHLYGHVSPATAYSTGMWMREVAALIASHPMNGRRLVFVGGTGLYFQALMGGLSDMPAVPDEIRAHWRGRLATEGPEPLHSVLLARDPAAGNRIRPGDGQRILRALEIIDATGLPIGDWQKRRGRALLDRETAQFFVIEPDRAELHRRIGARFDGMVAAGALDEVRALLSLDLDASLPAMKAIGVRELAAVLREGASLASALERAKAATRQYAKRQSTWFRNQLGSEWRKLGIEDNSAKVALPLRI